MKCLNRIVIAFLLLTIIATGNAQGLQMGQQVPEVVSGETINYSKLMRLSDFRGKPLIIDFWSTNCGGCINSFPKVEEWEKKYGDKVQLILVNPQDSQTTMTFFKKFWRTVRIPKVPMMMNCTALLHYFPLKAYPQIVWIDKNSFFRYRTNVVTDEGIYDFSIGKIPDIVEFTPKIDFVKFKSYFEQPNKDYLKDIVYYSYIAHYVPGTDIGNHHGFTSNDKKSVELRSNCKTITELLIMAFSEDQRKYNFWPGMNVVLNAVDTINYMRMNQRAVSAAVYGDWQSKWLFNYECTIPVENKDNIYQYMQQDICRFFNVSITIEKRMVKSLALVRINGDDKLWSKGEALTASYLARKKEGVLDDSAYYLDKPISLLLRDIQFGLNYSKDKFPIIDRTDYTGKINVGLPTSNNFPGLSWWKIQLNEYDLDLVETESLQDVLVIHENKKDQ